MATITAQIPIFTVILICYIHSLEYHSAYPGVHLHLKNGIQ